MTPAPSPEEKPCDHCDFQERDEREFNIKRQAAAQARSGAFEEIERYCQAEREDTRDAKYPSKDYERGMITMSNRTHSFAEHLRTKEQP